MKKAKFALVFMFLVRSLSAAGEAAKIDVKQTEKLFQAIAAGEIAIVEQLFKNGAAVNGRLVPGGKTPLAVAINHGKVDIVRLLLAKGASKANVDGNAGALGLALAEETPDAEVLRLLATQPDEQEALKASIFYNAKANSFRLIKIIVKAGIDVNSVSVDEGKTALIYAAREGWVETVRKLLNLGADASVKDRAGKTALDYALLAQKKKIWQEADYKSFGVTEQGITEIIALLRKGNPKKK